jgi:hypothetical protein
MPTRLTPRHNLPYFLLCVDESGAERREDDGTLLSERILDAVRATDPKVTDVFVMSHGWKGDVASAIEQYDRWIDVMGDCTEDRARAREVRPGFTPLLVGFHWPSLPFGEEGTGGNAFDTATGTGTGTGEDAFVDLWAERIADTPAARAALRTLFAAALDDLEPERLSAAVIGAYQTLDGEAGLGTGGPAAAPEADRAGFDPQQLYLDAADAEASFGGGFLGGLLSPLRELSFWTMKKRARACGETGGHRLVSAIRKAGGDTLRIHLMGHSFGCIVVSSMLRGTDAAHPLRVSSAFLVQGALSLWSFAAELPGKAGTPGWFRPVLDRNRVSGPMVVTTSRFDRAVGSLYPVAAGAAGQVAYDLSSTADLPIYGALGAFGAQGDGVNAQARTLTLGDVSSDHGLAPGQVYNVNGDAVIRTGGGRSGAHSDIAHPEVGHLFWSAVLAAP